MPLMLKDANLLSQDSLPNGAATVNGTPIQLHNAPSGQNFEFSPGSNSNLVELLLEVPALTTAELPDAQTVTYTLEQSDTSNFSSAEQVTGPSQLVQTGAGGVGAAAATLRFRPSSTSKKYVRAKAVKAGASNASTQKMSLAVVF